MTDFENIDDELLSAYLDDELTLEERARVDERLAADPRARQLLDELRVVSQTMKDLPPVALGADLRDSVLRRAERAMLISNERKPVNGASETAWTMPFGRSKRAWFWAGATLAAGLLLMFYERGANERGHLPNQVALRGRDAAADHQPMSRMEMRSTESVAAKTNAKLEDEAVALMTAAPTVPAAPVPPADDAVAITPRAKTEADELVVVHVNATPDAIQNRTFDAVLIRNDIQPEQPAENAARNAQSGEVDVVLVEAAPWQIYGCMDALEADKGNYLGIEVDDQLAEKQRARALVSRDEDLTKYNRGVVPPEQKVASNRYFYAQEDLSQLVPSGMGELNQHGVFSGRAMHPDANAADDRLASGPGAIAPMRSFGAAGVGGRQQVEAEQSPESQSTNLYYDATQKNMARRAVQKLAIKAEMLQVLFVLSSQTPPVPGAASVESATSEPAVSEPDAQPAPATSPATDDPLR